MVELNQMKKNWLTFFILILAIIIAAVGSFLLAKTGSLILILLLFLIIVLFLVSYIFKNPFMGFLMIIFFLPFERVPTYSLFGIDLKINTILGIITLIGWIGVVLFKSKQWKIQPNALSVPIGFFIIALLLSLLQAGDLGRSIQVFVFILFTIALSVMSVNMIPGIDNLKKIILVLLFSSFIVGIFGLFQFGGDIIGLPNSITLLKIGYGKETFGFPRIQAFSMEPLFFANYLLIPISLALAYFFDKVNIIKRWWLIVLLGILLLNFILTLSRGGYLGLITVVILFLFFYARKIFSWRNIIIIAVCFFVFLGAMFALSKGRGDSLGKFINQATVKDRFKGSESVQGRLMAYEGALQIFSKHRLTGIGIGNYGPYVAKFPEQTPKTGWAVVNNEYIEVLTETGIIGLSTFVILILVLLLKSVLAFKKAKDPFLKATLFGLFAAFCGILIQYNFFSTLYIIHIWVLIGLLVGVQNLILSKKT